MPVVILIVVIIALVIIVNCVKIVPQAHAVVVERLGGYLTTWSVGLHFKVPFIDRIAKRVLLKEQVVNVCQKRYTLYCFVNIIHLDPHRPNPLSCNKA